MEFDDDMEPKEFMESINRKMRLKELFDKAHFLLSNQQYHQAAIFLEQLVEELRNDDSPENLGGALGNLGIAYYEIGQVADARKCFEEVLMIARKEKNERLIANTLNELALIVRDEGNLLEAINLCQEALEIGLKKDFENSETLHNLSILYQMNQQFGEAKEILELVRESCEARHDLAGLGKALNELGLVYQELGDITKALHFLIESIMLKRRIGDANGLRVTTNNLKKVIDSHPEVTNNLEVSQMLSRLGNL
jgi:tetratricopeptide (TPR) repeat protein